MWSHTSIPLNIFIALCFNTEQLCVSIIRHEVGSRFPCLLHMFDILNETNPVRNQPVNKISKRNLSLQLISFVVVCFMFDTSHGAPCSELLC